MATKTLLTQLTTMRNGKRVRFEAKQAVDLTKGEIETLDHLTKKTGRLHYRDPINEQVEAEEPAVVEGEGEGEGEGEEAYEGENTPMDEKTVDQLKAYLDHFEVSYESGANKAALLKAAKVHETDGGL